MGDEKMDYFVFFVEPKDILNEYTEITGKSPMLPLLTFGTWMSRITYLSQKEGLDIAANLRKYKIPADVIHFDTGWFGVDWQCDYQFAADRFEDPVAMMKQMRKDVFHVCLWQLPYFTPKNKFFGELLDGGGEQRDHFLAGGDFAGEVAGDEAVLEAQLVQELDAHARVQ